MTTRVNWRQDAGCRHADPELFFPIGTAGPSARQVAQARAICLACQVRAQCLDWALRHGQDYGIWGGATEEERRDLRRVVVRTSRRRALSAWAGASRAGAREAPPVTAR